MGGSDGNENADMLHCGQCVGGMVCVDAVKLVINS